MTEWIRRLSPGSELLLINLICFGPFAAWSAWVLLSGTREYVYDDRRLMTIVAIEIVCGLLAAVILRARGWKLSDFGLFATMPETIWGFVLMFGTNITLALMSLAIAEIAGREIGSSMKFGSSASILTIVVLTLVNPLYEEFFEVAYNTRATESEGAAFAITLSAAIRFACNLYQGAVAAATVLPLGIIFAAVYWRWRRLWPLVVAHGVADMIGLLPEV
ncbi:MAG TPA: CPBP family intramembrane glutamic endopeptidase [Thermoanaerobaculia bacterium]|nr:CPBP family intramembrane glutamic endopeptidase [Thermoanaerobaculia bacterium]